MSWTEDQVIAYMAKRQADLRRGRGHTPAVDDVPDPGLESSLQDRCLKYCEERGWPCLSFHQSVKAKGFLKPGWPDMTIFRQNEVILIEFKSATGKLRAEQQALRRQFMFLGHEVHVCRSYKRFIEIMESPPCG